MFRLLRLEDRIVLDGAGMIDTLDLLEDQELQNEMAIEAYDAEAPEGNDGAEPGGFDFQMPLDGGAFDLPADDGGLHVLVVSSAVEDADGLADAARDGVTVVRYDADETDLSGLGDLIRDALGGQKADSIAIAAHNVDGAQVQLTGGDVASLDSLDGPDQRAFWRGLGDSLAEGGRIDLLACDVAGAEGGDAFLAKLEDVTGANVAASTDVTGNEAFGGDWVLETHGIDIRATYFDAGLEGFEGTLYAGQDPDPGYNDIYDRTIPSGKYSFIPVPVDTWQDAQGTTEVSLRFDNVPNWLRWNASSEGFWALKPDDGDSATATIIASDGFGNEETDDFTVTAYDNLTETPPSYPPVDDLFSVSEDAPNGVVVVPHEDYQIATDTDGTISDYAIVSGNPTDGTNFGFEIDGNGDIVVADTSLVNFNDPYVVNNTHQLVVRAEDDDGIFAFSTVEIQMEQGDLEFVVDLNVTRTTLEEDPSGANTAQITVNITPTPTAPVTVNLEFQGSGADPATGPGPDAGDDYDVTAQTLEFLAGQSSRVVTLTVDDDEEDEPTETFTVDIDPTGLPANYSVAAGTLTEFSIIDGARPTVGLDIADATFPENGSTVVTATLTGGTFPDDVQVPLDFTGTAVRGAAADPGVNDYTTPNDFITISAGQTSGALTLSGVVDNIDEGGAEDFTVSVMDDAGNPFNIDPAAASVDGEVIDVTVELPIVRITANRASFFEGETFQITAFLEDGDGAPFFAPAGGINVQMDYSGGTADRFDDFQVPGVIQIPEDATSQSITVFGVLDGEPEENETVKVAVDPNPAEYEIATAPFDVILRDVTAPVVTLELDGPSLITEDPVSTTIVQAVQNTAATTPTTVTLEISGDPAADRDIDYTATYVADGSEVATNADGDWTVVIPAGETTAGIRITAIQDGVFDGEVNEQIVVTAISAGTSTIDPLNDNVVVEIDDAEAGDIPVVNLFVDDGGAFVAEGELDEAPGALMKGTVKLPTGEVPPVPVTAYLVPSDAAGEAIAGTDYDLFEDADGNTAIAMVSVDGTMAWPVIITDGFNKANFWVGGLGDDDIFEGTESFQLSIFDVVNGTIGADDTIDGSINDATPPPVISLALDPTSVNEPAGGNDTADLTIDLTADTGTVFGTGETTVTFSQVGNAGFTAATADVDYTLFEADGTTPVAYDTTAGEWTATVDLNGGTTAAGVFVLKGLPDEEAEGTEGFELQAGIVSTVGTSTDTVTGTVLDAAADDPLNVTLETLTTATVTEGVGSARVDVSLSRVYNADLVVSFEFTGEADGDDFILKLDDGTTAAPVAGASLTYDFIIPDGFGTTAGFAIEAIDDNIFEPDEDLGIQITDISAAGPNDDFSTNVETVTIVDGLPQPEVSLFWKDGAGDPTMGAELLEPSTKFLYAGIDNPVNDDVVVDLTYSSDLGADFGDDYTGTASITILAGETEGRTLISVIDDDLYEPDEELFTVAIAGVTGPAADDVSDLVTGTILPSDLDGAVQVFLAWETAEGSEAEFNEGATGEDGVVVQLDRDTHESDVVVTLQFTETTAAGDAVFGDDYDIDNGATIDGAGEVTVTIPVGQTQAVLPISAFADSVAEPDEVFTVTIDDLAGGLVAGNEAEELGGAGVQELSAVILDATDAPEIGIELLTSDQVPEEGALDGAAQFRAVITNDVTFTEDITVTLDVIDGTGPGEAELGVDFTVNPSGLELTIAAGETSSGVLDGTGVLRVVPLSDTTFEGDEDLGIQMVSAEATSGVTFGVDDAVQTVTIVDDEEAPTVSLTPATAEIVEDSGGTVTVTLALSGDSFDTVLVDLFFGGTADLDDDYTMTIDGDSVTAADLTGDIYTAEFTGGAAGTIDIVFTPVADGTIEPDETIFVDIRDVTNAVAATAPANESEVTIIDDDLNLFVGLELEDNDGNVSPNALISENRDAFAGDIMVGTLTVNLLDDAGDPANAPAGFPVTVTLSLGGTAAFDDGAIVDFDYEISRDSGFTDLVTMSSVGTFDVTIAEGFDSQELFIRGVDDDIFEGTEPFDVTAVEANFAEVSAPVAALGGQAVLVTGLVTDNDDPPAVSLTALAPTSVTEGGTAEFSLTFEDRSSVETVITIDIVGVTDGADYPDDYTFEVVDTAGTTIGHTVSAGQLIFTLGAEDVFGDGSLGTAFTIRALTVDDDIFENDEDIVLGLTLPVDDSYTLGTTDTATATIRDNDEAPIVSLGGASQAAITEGVDTATITVDLSTTSGAETIVTLVFDGPATPALDSTNITAPPDDYTVEVDGVSTTFTAGGPYTLDVTIPAGSISAELTLTALADGIFEGPEDFIVRIDDAVGATPTTAADGLNETVTITDDDDPPEVILEWQKAEFNENGGSNRLIAQISEPVGVDATIEIVFGGDANYTPGEPYPPVTDGEDVTDLDGNTTTIVIPAGQTQGFVTFYGLEDDLYEADTFNGVSGEDFVASITAVTFGDEAGSAGATDTATAVIIDGPEDIPQVTLEVANTSVTEGESTTITVFRDTDPGVTTTVDVVFTTTMGADWVDDGDFVVGGTEFVSGPAAFSVSVDILPNQTFATIDLEAIADGVFEPDEQVEVSLVPVENGTLGVDTTETVTIIDDGTGTPVIALENQAAGGTVGDTFAEQEFFDGASTIPNTATFTVTLSTQAFDERIITLQLDAAATGAAEPGVDYTVEVDADGTAGASFGFEPVAVNPDGTFSFTIGAGVTAAEVRFTGEEDGFFETDETVIVSIADADGLTVTTTGTDTFTYTLIDDDPAPRVDLSVTVDEIAEDGGATSLFALLVDEAGNPTTAQTDIAVELDFGGNASIGDDYTSSKMIVTIPEGSDKSPAVFLESIDDLVYEGNETIVVSALSANITNALAGDDNVATVTILEDETGPTVSLSVDQTTIAEANGEAALTLDLSFTSPVDEVVYVSFTTTDDDSVGTFPPNGLADWGTEARYNLDNAGLWPDDYLATTSSGFTSPFGADFPNGVELPVVTNPNNGMQALAIVIPAGAPSETVYLHALNDNATFFGDEFLFEKDETFTVSIDADSFENNLTADPAAGAATVTIEDDDEALAPNVDLAWGLGGGSYTESGTLGDDAGAFTVTLDAATNQFVQVVAGLEGQPEDYEVDLTAISWSGTAGTAADNGDGTITLTFQTAAAGQTATVPFSIVDDNIYEDEETFNLTVEDVVFAKVGTADVLTMTITDEDDLPSITVGLDTDLDNIAEGTSGAVTEGDDPAGPQIQFIIGKGGVETPEAVLVDYVISSGTAAGEAEAGVDFSAITSGTVTLARDDDAIAIVDLQVTGDDLDEQPGEDVTITLSNARFADSGEALDGAISGDTATLTITDDDYTPEIVTSPALDPFVVSEGGFETITVDNLLYTDQDSVDDDLTYEIVTAPTNGFLYIGTPGDVDNSTQLEAGGTFDQFILGDDAIWYQHDDSETTEDSFFYTVTDGTNTISPEAEFNITVDPVNDAPEVESIIFYIQENSTGEVSSLFDGTGEGIVVTDQDGDALTATITYGDDTIFSLDTTTDGEVRLMVDQELDYEFQNAYALSINVTDGEFEVDTLVVVNVKDDASEPDPFEAGTIPTPDPILSDQQWAFRIPDEVFPDGELVTYQFAETNGLNTSPWLRFASEAQTFWYNPDVNVGPTADQTYDIEVTATYWHQNQVIKGVSQSSFTLDYNYIASLEISGDVLEALDFLETEDGDYYPAEDGEMIEVQEMMLARAESEESGEIQADSELADILALLEEDPALAEIDNHRRAQTA